MTGPATSSRAPRAGLLLAAALALTAAAYAEAPRGPFVWDDRHLILERYQGGAVPAGGLLVPFWRDSGGPGPVSFFRPLTESSYRLDWALSGGEAGWFHLVNVLLHLGSVALVFHLVRRRGGSAVAAALGAALFGVAPRATESVAWISGRTDVLAGLLTLGAFAVHPTGRGRLGRRWLAAGLLLLGLLSKEVAAVGLAGLFAAEVLAPGREGWRAVARRMAPALVALGAYLVLRQMGIGHQGREQLVVPWAVRLALPLEALGTYAWMLADFLRPRLVIGFLGHPDPLLVGLGALAAASLLTAAGAARRSPPSPEVGQALVAAGSALFLVLHLVPFRTSIVAADRFLYLPLAALAVAGGRAAAALAPRWRKACSWAALVAVTLSLLATRHRVGAWTDEERLWREAVATAHPANGLPWNELGSTLVRAGRHLEAIDCYRRGAVSGGPIALDARAGEASALSELGRLDDAQRLARALVEESPGLAFLRQNLALIEARRLDFDAAEAEARRALALQPGYAPAHRLLTQLPPLRDLAAGLPPPGPGEPAGVSIRRARLLGRVGREAEAAALYARVSADTGSNADALEAAGYLAVHAPPAEARQALARARELGADVRALAEVARALEARAGSGSAARGASDLSGPGTTPTPEIPGR